MTTATLNTTSQSQHDMTPSLVQPWGASVCVDVYECQPERIRDAAMIRRYVDELVELIDMRKFGPCHVVNFGEDERVAGFSMFQLIETSCISGHFANQSNTAYIDIFSCKPFDATVAASFTQQFFGGAQVTVQEQIRR